MRDEVGVHAATPPAAGLVPLLYHELRPEPSDYSYVLRCDRFARHLELFAALKEQAPDSFVPVLTFDDGHISNHAHAMPMLERGGYAAHFFITAGWTGSRAAYMAPHHLRDLCAAGHTVGAHGWSHALLTGCTDAELHHELQDARAALEDWIGAAVTSMSLPGGRANARVLRACRKAGFTTVWTSAPQAVNTLAAGEVGRFNILAGATDSFLQQLLDPSSGVLQRAARTSRLKAAAQRTLGDRLYARVWSAINRQEPGAAEEPAL